MDSSRFAAFGSPLASPISRRRVLRGLGGGLVLAAVGGRAWSTGAAASVAQAGAPTLLGNPAGRVLLPGEAGLTDFGLDFKLAGAPAVFFTGGETPGWSPDLQAAVQGFAFGYTVTLAAPKPATTDARRAVQVCVHHGFSTTQDADAAWSALTTAVASGGGASRAKTPRIREFDVVEVFAVGGRQDVLVAVAADQFEAILFASRTGQDLVTVAIADFVGKTPTVAEAVALAKAEAAKLKAALSRGQADLAAAFFTRWTPGFVFGAADGSAAGAPFFAWPIVLGGQPVPRAGQPPADVPHGVHYQSHVEGPFAELSPAFADHSLYYSAENSFFPTMKDAKAFQAGTEARLQAGLPGISLTTLNQTATEKSHLFQVPSELGPLSGIALHRIITGAEAPMAFGLNVVAVPASQDTPAVPGDQLGQRMQAVIGAMGDGLERSLLLPDQAPVTITIAPPAPG